MFCVHCYIYSNVYTGVKLVQIKLKGHIKTATEATAPANCQRSRFEWTSTDVRSQKLTNY